MKVNITIDIEPSEFSELPRHINLNWWLRRLAEFLHNSNYSSETKRVNSTEED